MWHLKSVKNASGPEEDIKPLLEALKAEGVFVRELDTRGLAFHSPVLQPHLPELQAGARQAAPSLPCCATSGNGCVCGAALQSLCIA